LAIVFFFFGHKFTILQQKKRVVKAPHDFRGGWGSPKNSPIFYPNLPDLAYPCDLLPINFSSSFSNMQPKLVRPSPKCSPTHLLHKTENKTHALWRK
jgi:hypothetical protein